MSVEVIELHHHGLRVNPKEAEQALSWYQSVLGLSADPGRPDIPGIPGYWIDCGNDTQIHVMGVEGASRFAKELDQDPTSPHIALAVRDIAAARAELDRMHVPYWVLESAVAPDSTQLFVNDPGGNLIELHQLGTCRCKASARG